MVVPEGGTTTSPPHRPSEWDARALQASECSELLDPMRASCPPKRGWAPSSQRGGWEPLGHITVAALVMSCYGDVPQRLTHFGCY